MNSDKGTPIKPNPEPGIPRGSKTKIGLGTGIGIGIGLGVVLGILMKDLSVGIAIGVALGAGVGAALEESNRRNKPKD